MPLDKEAMRTYQKARREKLKTAKGGEIQVGPTPFFDRIQKQKSRTGTLDRAAETAEALEALDEVDRLVAARVSSDFSQEVKQLSQRQRDDILDRLVTGKPKV